MLLVPFVKSYLIFCSNHGRILGCVGLALKLDSKPWVRDDEKRGEDASDEEEER